MSIIGNPIITTNYISDSFSGDASTVAFTLSQAPASAASIAVYISGLYQIPNSSYSITGTTLTFTGAPPTGTNNITVLHLGVQNQNLVPSAGSITPSMLNNANVIYWSASNNNIGIGNVTPTSLLTVTGTAALGNTTITGTLTASANVNLDSGTLFVDGTNNRVGINNTAPTSALTVAGTAALGNTTITGALTVSTNTATFGTTLYSVANGNIGIGVSNVRSRLTVSDGSINLAGESVAQAYIAGTSRTPISDITAMLTIQSTNNLTANVGGSIAFGGRAITGSDAGANWAAIAGLKENATSAEYGGYLQFVTRANGSSFAERMRITSTGNVQLSTAGTSILNSSGNPILRQTGSILQVVSTNYATRTVISQTTTVIDMTGMTVSITPISNTSKILVLINLAFNSPDGQSIMVFLDRNGTQIGNSTSSGGIQQFFGMATANDGNYRLWSASANFLDSPATTTALTYKLRTRAAAGSSTLYLNGTARNLSEDALGSSTITVMEIAA